MSPHITNRHFDRTAGKSLEEGYIKACIIIADILTVTKNIMSAAAFIKNHTQSLCIIVNPNHETTRIRI
jgi:hypothetical protein